MKIKITLLLIFLAALTTAFSQDSSLKVSGYVEGYYNLDLNRPSDNLRPGFLYSHNRSNEVGVNLAAIQISLTKEKVWGCVGIGAGSYMNANYANEPGALKNLLQASAGFYFDRKERFSIVAGVMPSHIGFETVVGQDNWTATRGLAAENSPYFETGARLTYEGKDSSYSISGLILNGWQRIQKVQGSTRPSFGTQITFMPSKKWVINHSTFIGTDKPDSAHSLRFFNDFYAVGDISDRISISGIFDYGMEQARGQKQYYWFTPAVSVRYKKDKSAAAVRAEYYSDPDNVIVNYPDFRVFGFSVNYDYQVTQESLIRIEYRNLSGSKDYFLKKETEFVPQNNCILLSLSMKF